MDIKYQINPECDFNFDEKGNTFLALRKIRWGEKGAEKLDIRKWYVDASGKETVGKGVSFITEEGPHELTKILVENNYGHTDDIINGIKNREDFMPSLVRCLNKEEVEKITGEEVQEIEEEYFDPSDILGGY